MLVHGDDVGDEDDEGVRRRGCGRFGGLDVMYNNAGGATPLDGKVTEVPASEFWRTMKVDLFGTFLGCQFRDPAYGGARRRIDHQHNLDPGADRHRGCNAYSAAKGGSQCAHQSAVDAVAHGEHSRERHRPRRGRHRTCSGDARPGDQSDCQEIADGRDGTPRHRLHGPLPRLRQGRSGSRAPSCRRKAAPARTEPAACFDNHGTDDGGSWPHHPKTRPRPSTSWRASPRRGTRSSAVCCNGTGSASGSEERTHGGAASARRRSISTASATACARVCAVSTATFCRTSGSSIRPVRSRFGCSCWNGTCGTA